MGVVVAFVVFLGVMFGIAALVKLLSKKPQGPSPEGSDEEERQRAWMMIRK